MNCGILNCGISELNALSGRNSTGEFELFFTFRTTTTTNLNSLSIERGGASGHIEVLEYQMGFASGPVEVPEQGDRHVPFVAIGH